MATVTREKIGNLHDKITVKLAREDYWPSFEKSLKHYAKVANVPGFRKGMVPAGMVKKMYGQSLFSDEVIKSATRELEGYMNQEKLAIFGQPMIMPNESPGRLNMDTPEDVDFSFEIGLKPEIQVPALDGSKALTRYKVTVNDKMIDDELERISRRYGREESAEAVTHKENIIHAAYQPCDADGNVAEGAAKKEDTGLLDKMPVKLQDMLMDKKAGDSLVFRPADVCSDDELPRFLQTSLKAGPEAADYYFKLTIDKVGLLIPREMDIMLFSEVFPNDQIMDEKAFRERIKEELEKEFYNVAERRLNDEIFELLVHQTPIELPAAFLKRWMREGQEKPRSQAEVEREFPGFDHQLRWTLISDKIIQDYDIRVTHEEVTENIKARVLAYFGMEAGDEAPWMDSYMQKVAKDEKALNETYRQIMFDRLFKFLQTKFNVVEKEVSEEEFFKLPDAHAAHHHHH